MDPTEQISYDAAQPPPNYVFVPKGDVYVTRNCRALSKKVDQTLFRVFDKSANENLGLHCHHQILEAVEADAAASAERREKAVAAKDSRDYRKNQELLFAHFPHIPEESARDILDHGFLKGSGRVGRIKVLDEKLRFNLAVNAHIRHKLTAYESILSATRNGERREDVKTAARDQVHDRVYAIADSWRGSARTNHHKPMKRSKNSSSAAKTSATRLESHRARRQAQAKRNDPFDPEAKAADKILNYLKLEDASGDSKSMSINRQEKALELAMKRLNMGESSEVSSGRYQRQRIAIGEDLKKLKSDPYHPMPNTRLAKVLKMHRTNGDDIASLGEAVIVCVGAQARAKVDDRATRRARRTEARRRENDARQKEKRRQRDLTLYG